MSRAGRVKYQKIRHGGFGYQFEHKSEEDLYLEEDFRTDQQIMGCYGCRNYRGGDNCVVRERIRFIFDSDYHKCSRWTTKSNRRIKNHLPSYRSYYWDDYE